MKILYIAKESSPSGYSNVVKRNIQLLYAVAGRSNVKIIKLPKTSLKNAFSSLMRRSSYGVSLKYEKRIIHEAIQGNYDIVFFESISYIGIIKALNKHSIISVCFIHNVDCVFFKQRYDYSNSLIAKLQYKFLSYLEKRGMNLAKHIICLTERDKELIKEIYGRSADMIIPVTESLKKFKHVNSPAKEPYLLFVGANFFANIASLKWFIKNVAPYVDVKIKIVGDCCVPLKSIKHLPENIELLGYVDSIEDYYINASAVIAPILSGSGMKTKTIEALSYGKYIIGSPEAFVGIDGEISNIGRLCYTAEEYITAIGEVKFRAPFNPNSYAVFIKKYSTDSYIQPVTSFFNKII